MRKRYKIVLNLELDDPDESYPAGGSYTHLSRLKGAILDLLTTLWGIGRMNTTVITLDKIVEKGEVLEKGTMLTQDAELIPKERDFYCPDCDTEFSAVGYPNPVFYADTVANCPRCGGKCWEATVKITRSEYERLKRIGAKPKTFN
jgi:Zn finger protein HypA/HybF involved in hydrogenase expression